MKRFTALKYDQNLYRFGFWYGAYRVIVATSLSLIFIFTFHGLIDRYLYPHIYFYCVIFYNIASIGQLFILKAVQRFIQSQILILCIVDILCFSALTFAMNGPNLQIGLLFVITLFIANLLLNHKSALTLTLLSIITVVYLQFFGSWFDFSNLNNIGNSLLLAFLFFAVYITAQFAVQRFTLLEKFTEHQSLELLQLQDLNRYILEQVNMGYFVVDEHLQIVLSNPASHLLLGIPTVVIFRKTPLKTLHEDLFSHLTTHQPHHGERFIFNTKQSHFSIHVQVQKLEVPKQTLTLLILQDAQKMNQHVQQLKLAALGQLSASIAHEIRNPLASIVQANSLYLGSDEQQQHMLNRMIDKQSDRINNIIQSTLDMAHHKATIPKDILLNTFVQQLIDESFLQKKEKIKVKFTQHVRISFDELQLRQVLINLIQNALHHNHAQSCIEVYIYTQSKFAFIDVIDFGKGIANEHLTQLFSPFFTTEINGTGLGLYLSHSFCEANQTKLNYIKLKNGTCFRMQCAYIQT